MQEPFIIFPPDRGAAEGSADEDLTLRLRVESDRWVGERYIVEGFAHKKALANLVSQGLPQKEAYRFLADERNWSASVEGVFAIDESWPRCAYCGLHVPFREDTFCDSACEILWSEAIEALNDDV